MSIFRNALRITSRHPVYLAVYVVCLSLMGLFVGLSAAGGSSSGSDQAAYRPFDGAVAVVDRDGSELSQALVDHLGQVYTLVDVADDPFSLQDALARGDAGCVVIVPEGYGEGLLEQARGTGQAVGLELASGYSPQEGALVSVEAGRWAALVRAAAAVDPEAAPAEVASMVAKASEERADVHVQASEAGSAVSGLYSFLTFSSYAVSSSVIVCAGVVFLAYAAEEVRRRNACAPVAPVRASLEQLAASALLVLVVWVWTSVLGCTVFGKAVEELGPVRVAVALCALLAFSAVPLALAFLLTRFKVGEEGLNACGNIVGIVMCFLGGAWVPVALMGKAVQMAARFSPTYWMGDAIGLALGQTGPLDGATALAAAADIGVVLLFALALACAGLALGRARAQA